MQTLHRYISSISDEKTATEAVKKFTVYRDFLCEKNKLFNLTAITDPYEIETKHFIDSLASFPYIEGSVADIGSGAGFPSLPLKIIMPDTEFTLVDSLNKRVLFLEEVIELLSLSKVKVIHSRAEDLDKSVKYNTVTARAVSRLDTLAEYCLPFVKKGGVFIAYKSNDCYDEINKAKSAIRTLGGTVEKIVDVPLAGTDIIRKLIIVRKTGDTPSVYPRGQNKPRKNPIS